MAVTLYHFPPSLCSQKVRVALAEKGVEWEERVVDIGPAMENYAPWYARLNPRMVVPTLVCGDREGDAAQRDRRGAVVVDSARIVRFVDEQFEGPALTPSSPAERQVMDDWIRRQDEFPFRELSYAKFTGLLGWAVQRSFGKRRHTLQRRQAENPDLAHLYGDRLRDVDVWEAAVREPRNAEALLERAARMFEAFDRHVEGRAFLAGDRYSLADAIWTVVLARTIQLRLDGLFSDATREWYQRMRARPSFRKADVWEDQRLCWLVPHMARSFLVRATG